MNHSKNFERYKNWYLKGSVTADQLDRLVAVGLITREEKSEIISLKEGPKITEE